MISLEKVTKEYGSTKAVEDLSFNAPEGGIFGLIGPNGAGKTTTIRMIMNIIEPDQGSILFDGEPLVEKDKDRIGYLPEERGIYKKSKVNDLLIYLGRLKGRSDDFLQNNIDLWLDRFQLSRWKDSKIEELSKGMTQKIQFIASVVHDPDILILDEPFSGLDPVSTDLLRESIARIAKSGKTILFSTHIMEQAERICNQIVLLNKGKAVVNGPLNKIKDEFGTRSVVVDFTGDGSFIKNLPQVEKVIEYPQYIEIALKDGADTDELLKQLIQYVSIRRFEIVAPSLHNIFVSLIKE
ncbi:MAG: ATP-binding cassette domain-containing protein [Sphaerochaetaceae bacterium]|nr:ATP-binding cassette domain-containing protein [Sphaerochaetaceae bacterium]MDC7247034.1 ATP-binding cassette domain-containing protein [Sphaerochaetaceae bacterium]